MMTKKKEKKKTESERKVDVVYLGEQPMFIFKIKKG